MLLPQMPRHSILSFRNTFFARWAKDEFVIAPGTATRPQVPFDIERTLDHFPASERARYSGSDGSFPGGSTPERDRRLVLTLALSGC